MQPYSISPLSITIHATALFCFSVRVTAFSFVFFFFVTRRGVLLLCARTLFISLFFFWALTFLAERVSLLRYTSHCAFGWHNEQTCITFFCVCVFGLLLVLTQSHTIASFIMLGVQREVTSQSKSATCVISLFACSGRLFHCSARTFSF